MLLDEKLYKRICDWVDEHKEEYISDLQDFARIKSVSRADLAEPGAPFGPDCRRVLLIGVLADKDYREMGDILNEAADEYVCVAPDSPRALSAGDLAEFLAGYGKPVQCCESIPEAVATAKEAAGEEGVVCAAGSLYMAGPIRAEFGLF